MYYIFSTLASDMRYTTDVIVEKTDKTHRTMRTGEVLIRGGAGVAQDWDRRGNNSFYTKEAVRTEVSEEDYEKILKPNEVFQLHMKNGFIHVETKKLKEEKVLPRMNPTDASAPKTEKDFEHTQAKLMDGQVKGK